MGYPARLEARKWAWLRLRNDPAGCDDDGRKLVTLDNLLLEHRVVQARLEQGEYSLSEQHGEWYPP